MPEFKDDKCVVCGKYVFSFERNNHRCPPKYLVWEIYGDEGISYATDGRYENFPEEHASVVFSCDHELAAKEYCEKKLDSEEQHDVLENGINLLVKGEDMENDRGVEYRIIKVEGEVNIEFSATEIKGGE